jgi:site-specific recombinase
MEDRNPLYGSLKTILFFGLLLVLGAYMVHVLNQGMAMARYLP